MSSSDVKWIKIVVDIFDDEKMLLIEQMPDADTLIVIWFKLLCFSGRSCSKGVLMINERVPCNDEMLSAVFRRPLNTVRLALSTFENLGMIEIIDGVVTIPNWGKHQTLDKIEAKKEYMRGYMRERRAEQKALITSKSNSKINSKTNVIQAEKETEIETEIEEDTENNPSPPCSGKGSPSCDYKGIVSLFNSICVSLPSVRELTDKRKKAISGALKLLDGVTFEELFIKVESSDFLTGRAGTWNGCGFDWVIKPSNLVKILEGNYTNKADKPSPGGSQPPKKRDYNESLY